ncbi:MAG TPA: hypothetical protein VFB43_21870 [Terracidiphilus sp.]|nr:hypothetical protein [Terracidiphilus sp.]
MKSRKTVIWTLVIAGALAGVLTFVWLRKHNWKPRSIVIQGAVIRQDDDPRKQLPITGALITASDTMQSSEAYSDASGYFRIILGAGVWPQTVVHLNFQHPGYKPLNLNFQAGLPRTPTKLFVAQLTSIEEEAGQAIVHPTSVVANIRVRYTTNVQTDTNVGSVARPFQVVNQGDIPCNHQTLCSPNGRWKASTDTITLDAGPSNVFRNIRASCIAGPCPFTRISTNGPAEGSRVITASALDWSDTATFLVEAEVFRDTISSSVRESYPVIFGRTLHFTLPPTQEGVSIEADVNGTPMVFPLGPDLYLSWATCTARTNSDTDKSTVYQCELKPDYHF